MRAKLTALAVAVLAVLAQAGCAGGFRVGGNNYGAGIGAYVGAVPDSVRHDHGTYYLSAAPPPQR